MEFSQRLKQLRDEKGWTLKELASKIDVTYNILSMYENGKRMPSRITQEALCDVFNVDTDYLMGESDIRRKTDLEGTVKNSINSKEIDLILAYRKAPDNVQTAIRLMLGIDHD